MGYCWTSGRKVNGRWKFTKCNGNSNTGPNNCIPETSKDNPRCRDCAEWVKTYKKAVDIVSQYDLVMKNETE
jgi:hypothetical protein